MKLTIEVLTAEASHRQPAPTAIVEALEALNLKVTLLTFVPDESNIDPRYLADEVARLSASPAAAPSARHLVSSLPGSSNSTDKMGDALPTHPGAAAHRVKTEPQTPKTEPDHLEKDMAD